MKSPSLSHFFPKTIYRKKLLTPPYARNIKNTHKSVFLKMYSRVFVLKKSAKITTKREFLYQIYKLYVALFIKNVRQNFK